MLLGGDFNTFCSKTELAIWSTLRRTAIQHFPKDNTAGLTHFTFFTVLPLERLMDFLIKRELDSEDFPFCGENLLINLSLNARSALLLFQFSQALAHQQGNSNFNSDFWLFTFRMEISHFTEMKENGTLGLWNRLYVDHLFTTWQMHFTDLEWDTLRAWTFDCKVGDLVNRLNIEMLSNSSSHLRRLYHLVLPTPFYNANFGEHFEDDWDVVTAEAGNFTFHRATLQSIPEFLDLLTSDQPDDADTSPALRTEPLTGTDEVFVTSGGNKFHLFECEGLASRTHPLDVVSLAEAKLHLRTLSLLSRCDEHSHFNLLHSRLQTYPDLVTTLLLQQMPGRRWHTWKVLCSQNRVNLCRKEHLLHALRCHFNFSYCKLGTLVSWSLAALLHKTM